MKYKLKRILIKFKLLSFVKPIYEAVYEIFYRFLPNYKNHQQEMINFYSQFIERGDLCFDVGANKGIRAAIFLKLGARVVAIEPQERCIKYLQSKLGKDPNFILMKKGLSDAEKELTMSICEEADGISTFSEKWKTGRFSDYKWNKNKIIACTTLDNLIKEFGLPVFCKIDVEGFEFQVLKGLSQPIKYLSFEFAKEFFDDTKACIDYLLSLGYKQFNYSVGESMQLFFPAWVEAVNLWDQLSSVGDNLFWGDIYVKY